MKLILTIFCLVFTFFFSPVQSVAETESQPDIQSEHVSNMSFREKWTAWTEKLRALNQAARYPQPGDVPLESNGSFNPLRLLYLDTLDMSPLSGRRGYGDWETFDGGKARLVSAYSGTRDNNLVFLSIQINLESGQWLKNPKILDETADILSLDIPLPGIYRIAPQQPLLTPQEDIFLPLIYRLKYPDKQTDFKMRLSFDLCREEVCQATETPLSLTLTSGDRFATSLNAKMIDALQDIAKPLKGDPPQTGFDGNRHLKIYLVLPKNTAIFHVYPADVPWVFDTVSITSNRENGILLSLTLPQGITPPTNLPVILKTSAGFFETTLSLTTQTLPPLKDPLSIFDWIGLLLALILFSPFYTFLWIQATFPPKSLKKKQILVNRVFKTAVINLILWAGLAGGGCLIPDIILYQQNNFWFWTGLLVCVLCLKYLPHSLTAAVLLFWLMPKSFAAQMATLHFPEFITAILVSLVIFIPALKNPNLFFKIIGNITGKKSGKCYFMLIVFLIWCALGPLLADKAAFEPFNDVKRQQAITTKTPLIVAVGDDICTRCQLNKLIFLKTGIIRQMQRQNHLTITQAPLNDTSVAPYLKNGKIPQILLFGPGKPTGQQLDDWTNHRRFKRFYQESILTTPQ